MEYFNNFWKINKNDSIPSWTVNGRIKDTFFHMQFLSQKWIGKYDNKLVEIPG